MINIGVLLRGRVAESFFRLDMDNGNAVTVVFQLRKDGFKLFFVVSVQRAVIFKVEQLKQVFLENQTLQTVFAARSALYTALPGRRSVILTKRFFRLK